MVATWSEMKKDGAVVCKQQASKLLFLISELKNKTTQTDSNIRKRSTCWNQQGFQDHQACPPSRIWKETRSPQEEVECRQGSRSGGMSSFWCCDSLGGRVRLFYLFLKRRKTKTNKQTNIQTGCRPFTIREASH